MRSHRSLLLTAVTTGALLVPVERAPLMLLHGRADGPLYAQALAGKNGRGGARGERDNGDRKGGKGHRGAGKDRKTTRHGVDPTAFVRKINNPYFPLKPGTVFVYKGPDSVNKVKVTRRTKEILGVRTTLVRDVELVDGELAEKTFDWYAQDRKGNVWYFGENTAEYENGRIISTEGSWKAGRHGARPGIVMPGKPKVGKTYAQEFAPGVAEDKGRVLSLRAFARVAYGTFRNVLKTFDFTPLDPAAREHKYFAPGTGQVLAVDLETGEREELVRIKRP
jgi:hypothetical protein